jgi:hypothetical protein
MVTVKENSSARVPEWLLRDPEQVQEWLQQKSLIYGALIGIGVVMVQPFLAAASLDLSAKICVVGFSVAIPLLAVLILVNRQEAFRHRLPRSAFIAIVDVVAQTSAFVGVVAGFWHISWIAGIGMLGSGVVGTAVLSAQYWRMERQEGPPPQDLEAPDDRES